MTATDGYLFYTRPHFLDEDLYLRVVIPPGHLISEPIRDHWPSRNSAVSVGTHRGASACPRTLRSTTGARGFV